MRRREVAAKGWDTYRLKEEKECVGEVGRENAIGGRSQRVHKSSCVQVHLHDKVKQ